ncbi:MAG: site-2 protease family protein [Deferrisomatales bacterium]
MTPTPPRGRDDTGVVLFRLAGIDVKIHYSWLVVFALIVWSVSAGYLPRTLPGRTGAAYWLAGLAATVLFFLSVLAHEFSHSLVAQRSGLRVPDITLFVFGGVSRMEAEARDPRTEMRIALVGPLSSFALAGLFWAARKLPGLDGATLAGTVLGYLTWINLALGVFNLIPGFPLDGGRVLRAALWWKTGSLTRATRLAADVGKGFGVLLMLLGAVQILGGRLIGGLWLVFIGVFLKGAAEGSYRHTVVRHSLEGVRVRDVMVEQVVTVPPDLLVRDLIQKYFLHYGFKGFPVTDGGEVVGVVSLAQVRHLTEEEQMRTTVGEVMVDLDPAHTVAPEVSLADALRRMAELGAERLLVMEEGAMVGLLTKTGLSRFLEIKQILER